MFTFKNVTAYQLKEPLGYDEEALSDALERFEADGCPKQMLRKVGWQRPLGRAGKRFTHTIGSTTLVRMASFERLLPADVVRDEVARRIEALEEQGRTPSRKERLAIKEDVVAALLPQAFVRERVLHALIDERAGLILVDTASASQAEDLLSLLRESLEGLAVRPLSSEQDAAQVMTQWLNGDVESMGNFDLSLGDRVELAYRGDTPETAKIRQPDLLGDEVREHIVSGKRVARLALGWDERLAFTLDDKLVLRQIKLLDGVLEEAADCEAEDPVARFDADLAIVSRELIGLVQALAPVFGITLQGV